MHQQSSGRISTINKDDKVINSMVGRRFIKTMIDINKNTSACREHIRLSLLACNIYRN